LKSTEVDMPLSSQVKSSRMCSSRPPSTWGHFSLKSGQVSVPQRLPGLIYRSVQKLHDAVFCSLPSHTALCLLGLSSSLSTSPEKKGLKCLFWKIMTQRRCDVR